MKTFFVEELTDRLKSDDRHPIEVLHTAQSRCADVGFDFNHIDLVMEKVREEVDELTEAYEARELDREHFEEEIGDCFCSLINLCRHAEVDPTTVIRKNVEKYLQRCSYIEKCLLRKGDEWTSLTVEEMYRLWKESKVCV